MGRSHYEVLGVDRRASAEVVRRAYLERARRLHPDHASGGDHERADAQRRMQEVNEAWRVLGDAGRRRRYDAELSAGANGSDLLTRARGAAAEGRLEEERFRTRADGTVVDLTDEDLDPTARLVRGLPWVVVIVVLLGIFVFTAYAVGGHSADTPATSPQCVTVATGAAGTSVAPASCGSPGARRVVLRVAANQPCPAGTERLQPADGGIPYCLEV